MIRSLSETRLHESIDAMQVATYGPIRHLSWLENERVRLRQSARMESGLSILRIHRKAVYAPSLIALFATPLICMS